MTVGVSTAYHELDTHIAIIMSTDPYHAVQHEIQSSLQTAASLRASFLRIRNMAREDSEELVWARNEASRQ